MKILTRKILNLAQLICLEKSLLRIGKMKFLREDLWDSGGYKHYEEIYKKYRDLLKRNKISLKNKKILEIGSGNSIGAGYFFITEGYSEWWASDCNRSPLINKSSLKKEINLIKKIKLEKSINVNLMEQLNKKLRFINLDLSKFNPELESKFDIILSNAVLEHIPKDLIKKSIENMCSYLKKGGMMIHEIDLRDHINVINPFGFYKYSEEEWGKLTKGSIFYTNRLRAVDYLKIFKRNKLSIMENITKKSELPLKINSDLRNKYDIEELKKDNMIIIMKK